MIPRASPRLLLRWLAGLVLLAGLLLWVDAAVGWGTLLAPWGRMRPGLLAAAAGLVGLSHLLRAVRVYDYLHAALRGRFVATLRLTLLHNCANNLLPMRLGEAVFPLLMRRYFGLSMLDSSLSLLWIRLLDLHFVLFIALLALALGKPSALSAALALAWLTLLPLGYALGGRLLARPGRGRLARLLDAALAQVPAQPLRAARIWLWTALSWSVKVWAFALVVLNFVDLDLSRSLAGIVGAELSSVLPVHGVAGAGSYEAAMSLALLPLGVSQAQALTAAVNLHLFLLGCTLLLGAVGALLPVARERFAPAGAASYPAAGPGREPDPNE